MTLTASVKQRFWAKVALPDANGCLLWRAGDNLKGYGQIRIDGRNCYVHRIAYELLVGPIPPGLQVDHCAVFAVV